MRLLISETVKILKSEGLKFYLKVESLYPDGIRIGKIQAY